MSSNPPHNTQECDVQDFIKTGAYNEKFGKEELEALKQIFKNAGAQNVRSIVPHNNFHTAENSRDLHNGFLIIVAPATKPTGVFNKMLHSQTCYYPINLPNNFDMNKIGFGDQPMTRDRINKMVPNTVVKESWDVDVPSILSRIIDEGVFLSNADMDEMYEDPDHQELDSTFDGTGAVFATCSYDTAARKNRYGLVVQSGIPSLVGPALQVATKRGMNAWQFTESAMNKQLEEISNAKADMIAGAILTHWGIPFEKNKDYVNSSMSIKIDKPCAKPEIRTATHSAKNVHKLFNSRKEDLGKATMAFHGVVDLDTRETSCGIAYLLGGTRGVRIMYPRTQEECNNTDKQTITSLNNRPWKNAFFNTFPAGEPITRDVTKSTLTMHKRDLEEYENRVSWCNENCDANRDLEFPKASARIENVVTREKMNWDNQWVHDVRMPSFVKVPKDKFEFYTFPDLQKTAISSVKNYYYRSPEKLQKITSLDLDNMDNDSLEAITAENEEIMKNSASRIVPTDSEVVVAITQNWKELEALLSQSGVHTNLSKVFAEEISPTFLRIQDSVLTSLNNVLNNNWVQDINQKKDVHKMTEKLLNKHKATLEQMK